MKTVGGIIDDKVLNYAVMALGIFIGFGIGYGFDKYKQEAAKQKEAKAAIVAARANRLQAIEDRLDKLEGKQKVITYTNWVTYTNWGVSNTYWLVNTNKK